MTVVEINSLSKSFDGFKALENLEMEIQRGEVYGLLGPNGAGKTTLFQTIMGQLTPTSGDVEILGEDAYRDTFEVAKDVSFLPADIRFYDNLTARKNLKYLADLVEEDPDIDELLELVNLGDEADKKVSGFSHGMQKRLGIAQTLIKDPEIILFDEPTTGLDPERKEDFKDLIRDINEEKNITVIVSSHILHELEDICDRIGVLKDGNIKVSGTPQGIIEEEGVDTLEEAYLEITRGDYR
ncbi:ABC transporter ATP-binding protein [Candidatus Nanohalobium constans]|uniref:ABC-2 type transport system ATP-binding protein n=1 Tax=Candidatus Nanohalobium constans TaxID=2565781 RepID=A0A5Q0UG78_9ARCH|nr:ABC transporter ATP-binding protein [Candidatus Nanohalobium constans]QGA80596.1 ABC-2 type transport system ATP-binding protein [Candidatus Nanohalobium constans]